MPDWKIHTICVLLVYSIFLCLFPFSLDFSLMALFVLLFSSLLPDLDHPRSFMRQVFGLFCSLLMGLIFFVSMETGLGMRLLSSVIMFALVFLIFRKLPLRHRGKRSLHKWKLGIILFLVCAGIFFLIGFTVYLSVFILIGYWLHLGLDRAKYKG